MKLLDARAEFLIMGVAGSRTGQVKDWGEFDLAPIPLVV